MAYDSLRELFESLYCKAIGTTTAELQIDIIMVLFNEKYTAESSLGIHINYQWKMT